jgi:UDP-glucose 4-epimerase
MKILITGGMGFVGGRLGVFLSEHGHEIIIGTRRSLNSPNWLPEAKMVMIDWASDKSLNQACVDVDLVIHTAAMNDKECELDPVAAHNFNGLATSRLLTAAINNKVKTFLYFSSAHVYSDTYSGIIDENTLPTNAHPYATSHLDGETHVLNAKNKKLINSLILRLANAYGTPVTPDVNCWMLLVNSLCKQATTTKKLKLSTSGDNQRNFITLSDVCAVVNFFIQRSNSQELPPIVNICNKHSNTAYEMAILIQQRCEDVLGYSPEIIRKNQKFGEPIVPLKLSSLHSLLFNNLISNNKEVEIDNLLRFCNKFFLKNYSQVSK